MQDEVVSRAQVIGIRDGPICILNAGVLCYAPGFVANDSVTVSAGCLRAVLVAVTQREVALNRHWLLLRQWLINQPNVPCFASALPPDSVSVLTSLKCTFVANLNSGDEWHFLAFRGFRS